MRSSRAGLCFCADRHSCLAKQQETPANQRSGVGAACVLTVSQYPVEEGNATAFLEARALPWDVTFGALKEHP